MLILLSPAKTLDFESPVTTQSSTLPDYLDDSCELIDQLKLLSPVDISSLMKISDKLGELNADRFQRWQTPFTPANSRQAALAFKGDVYTGLQAETLTEDQLQFAQQHVRILSGLYGVLRPLDLMQAYRLEMGTRFANSRGKNLYEFWGGKLTAGLNSELATMSQPVVVNLASNEYFKAVKKKDVQGRIVTPGFKERKNGDYKMISFYAKKARGLMTRYAIENGITDVEALKNFDYEGYGFNQALSSDDSWIFTREQP